MAAACSSSCALPTASVIAHLPSSAKRCAIALSSLADSGKDLRLLALELRGRDHSPVTQVSELGQLVRGAGPRGLLDVVAELLVLALCLPCRPLMHLAAAGDQVDQNAEERDDHHEQDPQGLGPARQIMTGEEV